MRSEAQLRAKQLAFEFGASLAKLEEVSRAGLMYNPFWMVYQFHKIYGLPISNDVNIDDEKLNAMRLSLIDEEVAELKLALEEKSPVEMLDALGDLIYVVIGAAMSWGLPLNEAMLEIHVSNLTKLDRDGNPIKRDDGKILKGPDFEQPDLEMVFRRAYLEREKFRTSLHIAGHKEPD